MMRVHKMGHVLWYHNPGVFTCYLYPSGASFHPSCLLARMPACGNPQTARHNSRCTLPFNSCKFKLYCSTIHTGKYARGIVMYLQYSSFAIRYFFMSMHMYLAIAVLTTLFQWSFAVSSPAVGTDNSLLQWIKFLWPSAVSFWGPPFAGGDQQLDCSK